VSPVTVKLITLRTQRSRPAGDNTVDRRTRWYAAYTQADPVPATAVVGAGYALAWVGSVLLGGSHSGGPELFYLPIVLAAVRFSWPVAVAASLGAGLLAGPLLPAEVASPTAQAPSEWLLRGAIFLAVGVFVALLVKGRGHPLTSRLQDAAASGRLLRALDDGSLEVFYQPIYRLLDEQLVAFEALVRWRTSPGRYAGPDSFIPAAERTGAISRIDEFVLDRAVAVARRWATGGPAVSISVNFSAATLAQPDLVRTVRRVLDTYDLQPGLLQVELTESALIEDLPQAVRQIEALRALGVKVAIDDFGSGYACLNYLRHFPSDVVKLDPSIVASANYDERGRRLLEGFVTMCSHLDLQIVAEGVEFVDQLDLLREVGVAMGQGFLLGVPAPVDALAKLLDAPAL
jgi:EAL domain-containing protein (putative c-di-GMP-specific phosphodiesterase class I)